MVLQIWDFDGKTMARMFRQWEKREVIPVEGIVPCHLPRLANLW